MTLAVRSLAVLHVSSARSAAANCTRLLHGQKRSFHATTARSHISYLVAGSCSAKGSRFNADKHTYVFNPASQDAIGVVLDDTHLSPVNRRYGRPGSGEDAFFASRVGGNSGAIAFAIADGVGGWAEHKVDPADVSHGLCTYMAQHALSVDMAAQDVLLRPKELLQKGYDAVLADEVIKAGGTTASVGIAQANGNVELANLGDSGSALFRLGAVHQYSTPQTHAFNTPFQLNVIPPQMRQQAHMFGGMYFEDQPRDAAVSTACMQDGDVLVLATDGVFDNLNNQEILKIVTGRMVHGGAWKETPEGGISVTGKLQAMADVSSLPTPPASPAPSSSSSSSAMSKTGSHHTLPGLVASSIVHEAKRASHDIRRDGPFAREAQRYFPGHWYRGGKVDDICVLVIVAVGEHV
ncbi:phosphatase 2C-like domain-containing protein [Talaromyces proteolyticus]|uniref:Protein phosphatase n=1 Tax=Talaromyces proteolyticus TaxID=1131652 RepID=A0AAD4Q336_9EURO|nr:phosphatase 2C-like domain-containing protein [Talaromyces proteolyticus]KAH8701016.1 phosphatase 2C-like domain-containing protein [Talaromyces proteolyticus]